jgi:excinuclease ABC subunit B
LIQRLVANDVNAPELLPVKSEFSTLHRREVVPFTLVSEFSPAGDQPKAIDELEGNLRAGVRYQTLHGITGSGKTYTVANVIEKQGRPALIMAPNKTLAAQLYSEFKEFFPGNRVRYFVSYYDYYQPEAYVPSTDTYIEKDSAINEEIDKMRHAATKALLETTDAIIVASVSCIYGLGAPEDYFTHMLYVEEGQTLERDEVIKQLVYMQYKRSDIEFKRGTFRVRGETVDVFPSDQDKVAIRLLFFGDELEEIAEIDSLTGTTLRRLKSAAVYPVSHFVTAKDAVEQAVVSIKEELAEQLTFFERQGKFLEAQRLEQRTMYDMELLLEIGFCPGIENYSRHLDGRPHDSPPSTLLDYFPEDFLLIIDESHVTVPQIGGMFRGDRARKQNLVNYGFRLPSALDNRPLEFAEFWDRVGQTIFVSATPSHYEKEHSGSAVVELINRPTGLLDPVVEIRPAQNQVDDLLHEIHATIEQGHRVLVTTLTKRMAEDFSTFLRESGIAARYLHSDIKTIERVEILRGLRKGEFDVLIGINLLREGLDLVEVALVAVLDADKEGFLRSETSIIQTIGRAARNLHGRAILYADRITGSIKAAVKETERRRKIQQRYNDIHGITPRSVKRAIEASLSVESEVLEQRDNEIEQLQIPSDPKAQQRLLESLKKEMFDAAAKREFEAAAQLRDRIKAINSKLLE